MMFTDQSFLAQNSRFVFLFAHPDDDAFTAGLMRILLEREVRPDCLWATSGGYLGGDRVRETELARAMNILGMPQSSVHLLKFPDLGLTAMMNQAAETLAEYFRQLRPEVVVVNAFEGGHPDHDSVNFLAYEASHRAGLRPVIIEFPLYNGAGPARHWWWKINGFPEGEPSFSIPLPDRIIDMKYKIMQTYSSQWMYMTPARLASPREKLKSIGEPYRRCPENRDHTLPPHPGGLNYERWFNFFMRIGFSDFRNAVTETVNSRKK